jgi:hypothetical protein
MRYEYVMIHMHYDYKFKFIYVHIFSVLGTELRASCMLGKHSATQWYHLSSDLYEK